MSEGAGGGGFDGRRSSRHLAPACSVGQTLDGGLQSRRW